MSCSSKRKMAAGSCINAFVSSTYTRLSGACSVEVEEGVEDFLGMACNLHLAPFAAQYTITIDQERAAVDAHVLAAVQALLADHVELPAQLLFRIAEQVKGQRLLVAEFLVRLQIGRAHV